MSSHAAGSSAAAATTLPIARSKKKPSDSSSSSSSSIGKNSDDEDHAASGDDDQVADSDQGGGGAGQRQVTGVNLNALEDALPMRKGLSEHHGGRMKSYRNLADAAGDSSIVKPQDPYSKKRKNRIAREIILGGMGQGPVKKKPTIASRSTAPPSTNVGSGTSSQDDKSTKSSSDSSSSDEKTA